MLWRAEVCLVETSNPENLGAVARLVENFGVPSLTLVSPRVGPDDHRAQLVARAARSRLLEARVAATLEEAVAGAAYVVGFSARRGAERPMLGLRELAGWLGAHAPAGAVALVFGPEESGLAAACVDRCDVIVAIETAAVLPSLNLAQAVAIALWELSRLPDRPSPARGGASHQELEALVEHAFAALDAVGYFRGDERQRTRVFARRLLADAALRSSDVRALHGVCAKLLAALARVNG